MNSRSPIYFIVALSLTSLMGGCKKFSVECEFVVKPYTMLVQSSNDDRPSHRARLYAFYNVGRKKEEAEMWRPASWEDASAGIIRHKENGRMRSLSLMATQPDPTPAGEGVDGSDGLIRMTVSSSPVVLVAVDPINRIYSWRVVEYEAPMSSLYLYVRFRVWRGVEAPYFDNETGWWMAGEAWEKPTSPPVPTPPTP